jgi:hypothetical protein
MRCSIILRKFAKRAPITFGGVAKGNLERIKKSKENTVPTLPTAPTSSGVPRGDAQDARASPLPPLCNVHPPPGHVHPPPSPA